MFGTSQFWYKNSGFFSYQNISPLERTSRYCRLIERGLKGYWSRITVFICERHSIDLRIFAIFQPMFTSLTWTVTVAAYRAASVLAPATMCSNASAELTTFCNRKTSIRKNRKTRPARIYAKVGSLSRGARYFSQMQVVKRISNSHCEL